MTESSNTMKVAQWYGTKDLRVLDAPLPKIKEDTDAVVKITSTTICGSDLHLYNNEFPTGTLSKGFILGHEFMGYVEEVGPAVRNIQKGDRVVVSAVISCGKCDACKREEFSACESTNPSSLLEPMYGDRTAGIFGYSHAMGGYPGGQAEFARVPIADVNLLKVPDIPTLPDEKVLFLSDIICTGWHANELGKVKAGQYVAVWGCGPVGLMAQAWAKFRGACKVIAIDHNDYRLKLAKEKIGCETIDFDNEDVVKRLDELCAPYGPDVCIDAVGFRYAKSLSHKLQRTLKLETDTPEIIDECVRAVRKFGSVALIGDYLYKANAFPIGIFMEKGLRMAGGQVFVQKYWKQLLEYILTNQFNPEFVISHVMPLEKAADAYALFNERQDEALKIVLKTKYAKEYPQVVARGEKAASPAEGSKLPPQQQQQPLVAEGTSK